MMLVRVVRVSQNSKFVCVKTKTQDNNGVERACRVCWGIFPCGFVATSDPFHTELYTVISSMLKISFTAALVLLLRDWTFLKILTGDLYILVLYDTIFGVPSSYFAAELPKLLGRH